MEQLAARHRQEEGQVNSEIDKLRASLAETQRMRDALNSVFHPSSERRSEEALVVLGLDKLRQILSSICLSLSEFVYTFV